MSKDISEQQKILPDNLQGRNLHEKIVPIKEKKKECKRSESVALNSRCVKEEV